MIKFGPSGNSESFYEQGYKSSFQMPEWLREMGLDAYEYSCSKGVNIGEKTARVIGQKARENNISLSIHAPYYISMASTDPVKRENSTGYVLETLMAARWMGAERIVVHIGACGGVCREDSFRAATETFRKTIQAADESGFGDIAICPEVLGKINQLGTLEEILELCRPDERLIPTVDFGHLHARGQGSLNSTDDFLNVLDKVQNELGAERLKKLHCHFSRIEFTKSGEKKHWNFEDTRFGPEFIYLAQAIHRKKMEPVIICESRGKMAEDALEMKKIYENVVRSSQK